MLLVQGAVLLAVAVASPWRGGDGEGDGAAPRYPPVPPFKSWFTPAYHMAESGHGHAMQDPAGNIRLADGTWHVFPCCDWVKFSSPDLVHSTKGQPTPMQGGTGSMTVRDDGAGRHGAAGRGLALRRRRQGQLSRLVREPTHHTSSHFWPSLVSPFHEARRLRSSIHPSITRHSR